MPAASGSAQTRFGIDGYGARRAGSFAGKTPYVADTPSGFHETRERRGDAVVVTWTWQTNSDGDLVEYLEAPINGTLQRVVWYHSDSGVAGSTYAVYLYDPLDSDDLLGLCDTISYNTTNGTMIATTLGSPTAGTRGVRVMAPHRLVIDAGADQTYGVFELHYAERFSDAHDVGGVI